MHSAYDFQRFRALTDKFQAPVERFADLYAALGIDAQDLVYG